jgi:hypothetical protein
MELAAAQHPTSGSRCFSMRSAIASVIGEEYGEKTASTSLRMSR